MESKKKKMVLMNLVTGRNKEVDIENRLEDMGWAGKVRVAPTYTHYRM